MGKRGGESDCKVMRKLNQVIRNDEGTEMDQDRKQIRKGEEKRNGRKITRKSELVRNEKETKGGNEERYDGKKGGLS